MSLHLNPAKWEGSFKPPSIKDVRWVAFGLLGSYLIMGFSFLGFSRQPLQVLFILALGAILETVFNGFVKGKKAFPLSALISCLSLSIILNYSLGYQYLWIPVFATVASKYLFTLNNRHFFNPSLFGIFFCLTFTENLVNLAPSYQWYGTAESSWLMGSFVVTGAVLFFIKRIDRYWLSLSFLFFFALQSLLRAYIVRYIIPPETLFIGAITSPAFYLFTFYMITDPGTSPPKKSEQIWLGFFIALADLLYHTRFSLYTFFFAGITVASIRFAIKHYKAYRENPWPILPFMQSFAARSLGIAFVGFVLFSSFTFRSFDTLSSTLTAGLSLEFIPENQTGIQAQKSDLLNQVDDRLKHVAKWILSVGDAVAVADVNNDGLQDLFFTQILKDSSSKAKLYLNQGDFRFEKIAIPEVEKYLNHPEVNGVPATPVFFDMDNDGDQDLFLGFGFSQSHLYENQLVQTGMLAFKEVNNPWLKRESTICLAANVLDFNRDGKLDLLLANTLPPYFKDYPKKVPFNIFNLPQPEFPGDRRMLHFMHESWHNACNGGKKVLLMNSGSKGFVALNSDKLGMPETHWNLAIGTGDINQDGWTDVYVASDFGHDDCYLNFQGKGFVRQQGKFFGEVGLDTYKGMNSSLADMDGDGREDIYVSNVHHAMQAEGSLLWLNKTDSAARSVNLKENASRMNMLNINRFGWGAAVVDLNLDGFPDIVQANGMVGDDWDKLYDKRSDYWYFQAQIARTGPEIHSYADKWADLRGRCIYENEADGIFLNAHGNYFLDVSQQIGFTHRANTRGVAAVDLDNDGDADLVVTDQFGAPKVYKNKLIEKQWLGIDLRGNGSSSSRDAIGARLWLSVQTEKGTKVYMKEQHAVNGFSAQGDHRILFGLGKEKINKLRLKVCWPDGRIQQVDNLQSGKYITLEQAP
ncbi:MAG: FG-GAP-like repeat-containing protein [Bacteroidia bacterium]|nr:FG-GAP-like repeat-containing protein [Bacteroidia bacterium]